ncbi:phosphopantetheine-binding protein [Lachnotalea glycerini]|uniref:Carrier domain-containing protein n=1 Tax=Lachnotalea glycerini TaxID=1763509 RepID=A0A371JGS0_9FIRM|nr:phosphopantetheine-binding protein [Lachnotalea glycerini]RDY31940.1 hypothetical protein CG710_007285 [Lachnotalea glycerini]
MEQLGKKVVEMVIRRCKLNDVDPETCDYDAPLFLHDNEVIEGGLELDSVDALELVAGIKEEFGFTIDAGETNVFYSINTLVEYIQEHLTE